MYTKYDKFSETICFYIVYQYLINDLHILIENAANSLLFSEGIYQPTEYFIIIIII